MNDQQRDYLRDLAKMAVHSALFGVISGLPRWVQFLVFVGGAGFVLWLLA